MSVEELIHPFPNAFFTKKVHGDIRKEDGLAIRQELAAGLQISDDWAIPVEVHGATIREASAPGKYEECDGLFTRTRGLPILAYSADCVSVIVQGKEGVGVAHAGWKGMEKGVIANLVEAMTKAGIRPERAAIGPSIGPCCFNVGPEVADLFPNYLSTTREGVQSVDLWSAAIDQLKTIQDLAENTWQPNLCTACNPAEEFFSHRRQGPERQSRNQAAVTWLA